MRNVGTTEAMDETDMRQNEAQPPSPLLCLRGVTLDYGSHRALDQVSLDLFAGEIFVLMGPNGAGKSSLVRVLTGALLPDRGSVQDGGALSSGGRRSISLVPQEIALYSWLTARENCIAFARIGGAGRAQARQRADHALELTRCTDVANVPVTRLSGGYQRRINIAAALANEPSLIILDEPTVGVDLDAKRAISHLLLTLKTMGTSIVVVTHDFPEADMLADRAGFLMHGRLVLEGRPKALADRQFGAKKCIDLVFVSAPDAIGAAELKEMGLERTPIDTIWTSYRATEGWDATAFADDLGQRGFSIREMRLRDPGLEALYLQVCRDGHPA